MASVAVRDGEAEQTARHVMARPVFLTLLCIAFCGFTALGVWQLYRLQWKLDLIDRVETRIRANPVVLPAAPEWPQINAARDEYKHVRVEGHFIANRDTRVQALTELGAGFWVLSPFQLNDGNVVLINRGYVPSSVKTAMPASSATVITGLLRMSESRGGFLRDNAPADNRWYSRDVAAIAGARGLEKVAPFFVDADAEQEDSAKQCPRGGLTVTQFSNNHLQYALTWFGLVLLCIWAAWHFVATERRLRGVQ